MADRPRILWFRRDLRLADHPALLAAHGLLGADRAITRPGVVPVFVVDSHLWEPAGQVRRAYLAASLAALDSSLRDHGAGLVIRTGDPLQVVPQLAREVDADEVHVSNDFGLYGSTRDAAVRAALDANDVRWVSSGSPYAVAPGRIRKGDGTPFRVYTPFFKAWQSHGWRAPTLPPPDSARWLTVRSEPIPPAPAPEGVALPAAGERAAHERWEHFLTKGLDHYRDDRDRPDLDGTSALSAALRWGEIHPRTLLAQLSDAPGHETYRKELAWREFYADVLHHNPASARASLRPEMAGMRIDEGLDADARFVAWQQGRTGYPFVDAGMRQLLAEGWMHNRVRMVVASFLVKDLHLDWRRGARHFMQWLRDGDLASNQHGWQWTAGTGTDAAPYFRVFNPVTQGLRFDPNGDYIRRYIPELRGVAGAAAHEPWDAPLLATDYPARIVDHAVERDEALNRLAALKADKSP